MTILWEKSCIFYKYYNKNLLRLSEVRFLLNLRASASAIAPSEHIRLDSKIMAKWKNNGLIREIINIHKNFCLNTLNTLNNCLNYVLNARIE